MSAAVLVRKRKSDTQFAPSGRITGAGKASGGWNERKSERNHSNNLRKTERNLPHREKKKTRGGGGEMQGLVVLQI